MRNFLCVSVLLLAFAMVPADAAGSGRALHLGRTGSLTAPLPTGSSRNITLEMWVRPSTDSAIAQLLYIGNGGMNGFGLIMHDGVSGNKGNSFSLHLGGVALSATGTSGSLAAGRWTHIAITRGEKEWRLYRNGALVGRSTADANAPTTSFLIGPDFDGDVDEVRFWERERTQAEILQSQSGSVSGAEQGLRLYYDMNDGQEGIVYNRATPTGSELDGRLTGTATFFESDLRFASFPVPSFRIERFASHMQFVPRGDGGFGVVSAVGEILTPGFDSIAVEVLRENEHYSCNAVPLEYGVGGARFAIDSRIRAELAEYTLRLVAIDGGERILLAEGADIVCGDSYLIAGESVADAADRVAPGGSRFVRSYGVLTSRGITSSYDPADTMWGRANAHGFGNASAGSLTTGIWGLRLQEMITENHGIPICIINASAADALIQQNLPSRGNELTSVYGRARYRAEHAGIRQSVRAIFWYHGESQTIDGYAASFRELYDAWHRDYPGLEKIYVFQIRPGSGVGPHGALREFQRNLDEEYDDIVVMPTAGLPGHDGRHYTRAGYLKLAVDLYPVVARDLYGADDRIGITPPDLERALFTNGSRDEVALIFKGEGNGIVWPGDMNIMNISRSLTGAFYLDGAAGEVVSGRSSGDTIYLALRAPSTARTISYLPDRPWYDNTTIPYQGPWLLNGNGIGALSFHEQPIGGAAVASTVPVPGARRSVGLRIAPNPVSGTATISFDSELSSDVPVSIIDMGGSVLLESRTGASGAVTLDLSALPPGIYLCRAGSTHSIFPIVR